METVNQIDKEFVAPNPDLILKQQKYSDNPLVDTSPDQYRNEYVNAFVE